MQSWPVAFPKLTISFHSKNISLAVNAGKTKHMETGRHGGMIANGHIKIGNNSYEKVKTFKYLGSLLTNQNFIQEEIKCRLKAGNSCYYSVQTLLSSRLLPKKLKIKIYKSFPRNDFKSILNGTTVINQKR